MNTATVRALGAINRRFYQHHSASFSRTRNRPWPGWASIIEARDTASPLSVLDAGCGNGRFVRWLAGVWRGEIDYVGIDASLDLLAMARARRPEGITRYRLGVVDLLDPRLATTGSFDLIVALGLMHHIPGYVNRIALLRRLGERLAPEGQLAVAFWRFAPRIAGTQKVIAWQPWAHELDLDELEAGDYLLAWQGDRSVPRYCHHTDDDELARLESDRTTGLTVVRRIQPENEDNLYLLFERS
ncbi:MAG: class I SAM-dependent methyltransferase [Acidobacteriota bacterium]